MISAIMTEPDFAEVLFLIALILFLIGGFVAFQAQTLWATICRVGLAAVAFGWLAL